MSHKHHDVGRRGQRPRRHRVVNLGRYWSTFKPWRHRAFICLPTYDYEPPLNNKLIDTSPLKGKS